MSDMRKDVSQALPAHVTARDKNEVSRPDVNFPEAVLSADISESGKLTLLGFVSPDQPVAETIKGFPASAMAPKVHPAPDSGAELPYFDPKINKRGVTHFVGRDDAIRELHERIESINEPTRVVVLQGLGGQGKTAIAVQYAHQYGRSGYRLVFWVDASTERSVGSACHRIVRDRKLIKHVDVITDTQAVEAVTRYLQSPEAECLVLFDNLDGRDTGEQQRITAILPLRARPRERVTIIITSRVSVAGAGGYGRTLRIEGMREDDAMELLRYRWMPDGEIPAGQLDDCKKILEDVGYLPLAIEQIGSYLRQNTINAAQYRALIKKRREKARSFEPPNFSYARFGLVPKLDEFGSRLVELDEGPYVSAFVTWDASMVRIGGGDEKTPLRRISNSAKLLRLAAFLSRDHLPSTFFAVLGKRSMQETSHHLRWLKVACSDSRGRWDSSLLLDDVVSKLTSFFLLTKEDDPEDPLQFELITHPLVREWALLQRPSRHIASFFQAAIELVKYHMQPDNFDVDPEVKDTVIHQLDAILQNDQLLYDNEPPLELPVCLGRGHLVPITFKFASFYLDYGIYDQTHSLYTRIIERNPKPTSDEERHNVLEATEGLAIVELLQGSFRQAEKHCRAALKGYKKLPEAFQESKFRALHNLGEICGAQHKFSEILGLFKESLEGSRGLYGDRHILTLREVEAYANAHRVKLMYDEASKLYEEAIDGMKACFEIDDHPDLLGAIEGLAIVRKGQRRYAEAEENYKIALEGDIEHLGDNHPDTINVVEGLGDVYAAQQLTDLALERYRQVRDARVMVVGDKHPDTLRIEKKIGEVLNPTGAVDFAHDTAYYPWYRAITSGDFAADVSEQEPDVQTDSPPPEDIKDDRQLGQKKDVMELAVDRLGLSDINKTVSTKVADTRNPALNPRPSSRLVLFDEEQTQYPTRKCHADEFFQEFELFRDTHRAYWGSKDRIKVAVLDTGFDKEEEGTRGIIDKIEHDRGKKGRNWNDGPIKLVKSFVDDGDGRDTCGHGTRVAQLILRLAPQADLYIAKISRGFNDEDEAAARNIAQAIKWATELKVDIITMSFGLPGRPVEVLDAIRSQDFPRSCLLFAAASNWGGNRDRPYPANDTRVICINATDGKGHDSGLNPHGHYHDAWATLGVDIEFSWEGSKYCASGTSYATPIAVAIAINAIDYVENLYKKGRLTKEKRDWLFQDDGMRFMFRLMSQRIGEFDYVTPWKLWRAQHRLVAENDEDYVFQELMTMQVHGHNATTQ
ncbi:hypothetical protein OQA88_10915 [Cercophora sp. LCS_1]